jgi:acyl-CoA synthetase (AMP-forming)/AMP-acid ligase II
LLLSDGGIGLSYLQFRNRCLAIGNFLKKNGVLPGDCILISSERHVVHFVSLLGAWSVGAVAVPLAANSNSNPSVNQLSPRLVIDNAFFNAIEDLVFDTGIEIGERAGIIIFTSGSTGAPKAVDLPASVILRNSERTSTALRLGQDDRILINTPPYFTSAVIHFLTLMAAGGSVVASSGFHFGSSLETLLKTHACTGFGGAPAHLVRLFDTTPPPVLPERFRFVVSSGDHLSPSLIQKILADHPGLAIFTLYGLTEVGGRLCVLDSGELPNRAGSVGKPLPGMSVTVRRSDGSVAAAKEIGEVFVEGPLLMRGYLNDVVATQATLTPLGLRTGDFGYLDEEGFLWLVGRQDGMFKSAGEKVSTALVAEKLLLSGLVSDVAVIAEEDPFLGRAPHAYVVPVDGVALEKVKAFARQALPPSHMPKKWHSVTSIPRTGSGKVIREELRRASPPSTA